MLRPPIGNVNSSRKNSTRYKKQVYYLLSQPVDNGIVAPFL